VLQQVIMAPVFFRPNSPERISGFPAKLSDLQDHCIAQLYIGVGWGEPEEKDAALREASYIIESLRAWLLEQSSRERLRIKDKNEGSSETIEGLGHQVKKLPLGFSGKNPNWLLSKDEFDELQSELKPPLNEDQYRLVPFPELLDGVGDLLTFWSFEYDPKSLLIDKMFESFACLLQYAADFATKSHRARAFAMVPMTTEKAASRLSVFPTLRVSANEWSKIAIYKSSFLSRSGKLELTKENQLAWRQFAGILRLLVVICEDAIQHCSKTEPARVECTLPDALDGKIMNERFHLFIANPCRPKKERVEPVSTRIGMKGEKIKEFLCERFLFDLDASVKPTKDTDKWYEVAISFNECKWAGVQ